MRVVSAERNATRRRHPSHRGPVVAPEAQWTSIELSAPVEAIRMLELAELISETEQKGDGPR